MVEQIIDSQSLSFISVHSHHSEHQVTDHQRRDTATKREAVHDQEDRQKDSPSLL
jgi:hypothetical protein